MNLKLKEKIKESLSAVLPITGIVLMLSIFLVPMELGSIVMFLTGAVMLIVGMGFFQLGAEMAMTPIGEGVGVQISKMKKLITVLLTGFVMGVIITVSEPDLQVLAGQVPSVPNAVLIMTVAIGVGLFLALAIVRIRYKISLPLLLIICYAALILISLFVPKEFLAVAFDSGGVTTGPMTVPFIMAMGVGLASVRSDKNAASDSFGLVALSSVGPILAVLILGCFYKPTEAAYTLTDVATVVTTQDVARVFAQGLPLYAKEVLVSLLPIIAVFLIFQMMTRRYQKRQIKRIAVGFAYTYIGLVLFLCGANVGFAPLGSYLGKELTGVSFRWILIPIGMLIGYYIVKAEPAIQVLNHQVETVTNGAISVKMMNRCMSIGVAVSVGLAMLRVLTGISIQWFVIPGYLIALVLSRFVPDIFIGIAFDSGGVASGPMTSTFLLPLSIGVCEALGGNLMTDAFGVVALVALTPLIAIQLMGLVYKLKTEKRTSTGTAEIADAEMFKKGALPLQYRFNAEGTASSEIMDMLGLGSIDKSVLISMIPKELSDVLMDKLRSELQLNMANSGIAFTIPLNGANNLILRILAQNTGKEVLNIGGKEENSMSETKYSLVAAIVNRGFSGDVMETVRGAGAKGGTVIHSRRIGNEDVTNFWGLSVQDEKEIVLILTESANKVALMKCIGESCGMHSEAQGIVMSMPIDSVAGI